MPTTTMPPIAPTAMGPHAGSCKPCTNKALIIAVILAAVVLMTFKRRKRPIIQASDDI